MASPSIKDIFTPDACNSLRSFCDQQKETSVVVRRMVEEMREQESQHAAQKEKLDAKRIESRKELDKLNAEIEEMERVLLQLKRRRQIQRESLDALDKQIETANIPLKPVTQQRERAERILDLLQSNLQSHEAILALVYDAPTSSTYRLDGIATISNFPILFFGSIFFFCSIYRSTIRIQ